jgi:hypothetical protein
MVAKIISGKSLIGALNYNEKKVAKGKAELIAQSGYAKNVQSLKFHDKLLRLQDLAGRNERVKTNTLHISLNFPVSEKVDNEMLNAIALDYMQGIGFANQPFLVYLHKDAGHPHIHIVSTNIKSSGERISLHNLGRTKSEEARKDIEVRYGLVAASTQSKSKNLEVQAINTIEYGKTDTKRAITNVLNEVIRSYKYTSLPELNAVLKQFNIEADRGAKESRMFQKRGLIYWALDSKGNKVGVPIKASSIYIRPTLKNLEEKFALNESLRKPQKERLRSVLDGVLQTKASQAGFKQFLLSKGIQAVFRENDQGRLYGVTYVDNRFKVVFNGSDLGKQYSAAALNDWFVNSSQALKDNPTLMSAGHHPNHQPTVQNHQSTHEGSSLMDDLLNIGSQEQTAIPGMVQNPRKKKKRRLTR